MTPSMTAWPPTSMSSGDGLVSCMAVSGVGRLGLHLVLFLELFDAASGVDQLLLAREVRMAGGADVHADFRLRRSGLELVPTRTGHKDLVVLRMDLIFHFSPLGAHETHARKVKLLVYQRTQL